jgi:hypothetical protein
VVLACCGLPSPSISLGLGTAGPALLFGALEVATLLGEVVAIALITQAVEGRSRACMLEVACSVEGAGS